jgi:hypothetical protein
VLVVNHDHMQRAARQANHHGMLCGEVLAWYRTGTGHVYLSDRIKPRRRNLDAAIIAHEFTHYFQDLEQRIDDISLMETEADEIMSLYFNTMKGN